MQFLDEMMKRLRDWCADRASNDETAGLDARAIAAIRRSRDDA